MDIDQRSLRQRLDAVPLTIRTKMGLDETTEKVLAIKEKFHIDPKDGVLARLILRLMIEDLVPQYFAWEIKEILHVDPDVAKKISEEVRDKVLEPARADFKKIAIDISMIGVLEEPPKAPAAIALNVDNVPSPKTPLPTAPIPKVPPVPMPPAPTGPIAPTATPAPFMMHQESSATPLVTSSDFKLNIPKDMFRSTPTRPVEIPRPPKAAELEIGKAPLPPKPPGNVSFRTTPATGSRVVHYTDLRTATPSFGPAQPATPPVTPPVPKPPAPIAATPIPATTPLVAPKVVNFGPEEVK